MKHEIKLNTEIENILYLQNNLDPSYINYEIHKNIVILKGVIDDKQKKRLIKQAILDLQGIKTIIDKLVIRNGFKAPLPVLMQ